METSLHEPAIVRSASKQSHAKDWSGGLRLVDNLHVHVGARLMRQIVRVCPCG